MKSADCLTSHSKYFPDYNGPLFKSHILGNYELLQAFPESDKGTKLPAEVSKLLGQTEQYIGAYPPIKE